MGPTGLSWCGDRCTGWHLPTISYLRKNVSHGPRKFLLSFTFVCFTYIFFRADKISDAFYVISHSSNINIHHFFGVPLFTKTFYIICLVSIAVVMFSERLYAAYKSKALSLLGNRKISYAYFFTLLLLVYMFGIFEKQNFVYFQF